MKRSVQLVVVVLSLALTVAGCKKKEEKAQAPAGPGFAEGKAPAAPAGQALEPGQVGGLVVETMDGGGYTYVRVETEAGEIWAAGPQTAVAIGDRVVMPAGMEMTDFNSTALNRTFPKILFVQSISVAGRVTPAGTPAAPAGGAGQAEAPALDFTGLKPAEGGLTVAGVFDGGADLVGKQVTVRGIVAKMNRQIMDRNWLHLQDGTGEAPNNDLTVTTQDDAGVGDTVLVSGTVARNSATFHGGPDKVILEGAKVTVEKAAEPADKAAVPAEKAAAAQ